MLHVLDCVFIFSCINVPIFFFSSRRRHTRSLCDWSSDVCSSDLDGPDSTRPARNCSTSGPPPGYFRPECGDESTRLFRREQAPDRCDRSCGEPLGSLRGYWLQDRKSVV